jgi:hypothetical protein
VIFFSAMRAGTHPEAALAVLVLALPAGATVLLAALSSDSLFSPKYRALARDAPGLVPQAGSEAGLMVRILIMVNF